MKRKRRFLWFLTFLLITPLYAQEDEGGGEAPLGADEEETVFYISSATFQITGRTKPWAAASVAQINEGERITGKTKLDNYIKGKEQILLNTRVLESARITYTLGEPEEDGEIPAHLVVELVDTINFIVLPEPKYSTSEGFDLELKIRDYNILGTMYPLRLDIGYMLDADHWDGGKGISQPWEEGSITFGIDSDTPFKFMGFLWNFNFDHDFAYTFGEPLYYKNTTGVSMDIPWGKTTITVGFEQSFVFSEKNSTVYQDEFGEFAPFYTSSALSASWKIPLGVEAGGFGELTYTPKITGEIKYNFTDQDELRKGPDLTFSQIFGFGRINWFENFRNGLDASIENSNTYNIYRNDWSINYSASARAHKKIASFFGVSGRLSFNQWFFTNNFKGGWYPAYAEVGDKIRGVRDNTLIAENAGFMLLLNADFPLQILHFTPSEWFGVRALRYFNFDMHVSPFIDAALLQGKRDVSWSKGRYTDSKDSHFLSAPVCAAGLEIIVFPLAWRSFYLRVSAGYNINKIIETGKMPWYDEIFIGVGHHY
ncbi:MAG: hypothetical protein LBK73_15525 [Treponema sp.]|jgi:hypothetical protein|nr:hypothetical protein [Treponema sp.]